MQSVRCTPRRPRKPTRAARAPRHAEARREGRREPAEASAQHDLPPEWGHGEPRADPGLEADRSEGDQEHELDVAIPPSLPLKQEREETHHSEGREAIRDAGEHHRRRCGTRRESDRERDDVDQRGGAEARPRTKRRWRGACRLLAMYGVSGSFNSTRPRPSPTDRPTPNRISSARLATVSAGTVRVVSPETAGGARADTSSAVIGGRKIWPG